jgi:hypothetical protein
MNDYDVVGLTAACFESQNYEHDEDSTISLQRKMRSMGRQCITQLQNFATKKKH